MSRSRTRLCVWLLALGPSWIGTGGAWAVGGAAPGQDPSAEGAAADPTQDPTPDPTPSPSDLDDPWRDVWLGEGFRLDLTDGSTGAVDGAGAAADGTVVLRDGRLVGTPPLARWMAPVEGAWSPEVVRAGGVTAAPERARRGQEFLWDLGGERWGYLRVVRADDEGARLEVVPAPPGTRRLERDPVTVEVASDPGGHRLRWVARDGARYLVQRRTLGEPGGFADVAEVGGPGTPRAEHGRWTDSSVPPGVAVEYRVRNLDTAVHGARVHALRQERPGDWPVRLVDELQLDVLTGTWNGERAHVQVLQARSDTVVLEPLEGTRLSVVQRVHGGSPWDLSDTLVGKGGPKARQALRPDSEVIAITPEDIWVRLELTLDDEGEPVLRRQVDLSGSHVFARAPEPPLTSWSDGELHLGFAAPPAGTPDESALLLVVERELEVGVWEELGVGGAGERSLRLPLAAAPDASPLARVRARHAYPSGTRSLPTAAIDVLLLDLEDAASVERALDRALERLGRPDYRERLAARQVLVALGPRAFPRLAEILQGEGTADPEVRAAVQELLLHAPAEAGLGLDLVLRARGVERGLEGAPPEGFGAREVPARVRAHLRAHGGGPDARAWLELAAAVEPDPHLRALDELLIADPEPPLPPRGGVPTCLVPPARRPEPGGDLQDDLQGDLQDRGRELRVAALEADARELAQRLRAEVDDADPTAARVLLTLVHTLEAVDGAWDDRRGDVELALRLLLRARELGDETLLRAAATLAGDAGAELRALRERTGLRRESGVLGPDDRERIELEPGDAEGLATLCAELGSRERADVDVVLPAGEYRLDESLPWLDLGVPGLRLVGRPGARLVGGLRVIGVRDVVVEGLHVHNERGNALFVQGGEALAIDCVLHGLQRGAQVTDGSLGLEGCEVGSLPDRPGIYSVQLTGGSELDARGSWLRDGTLYMDEGAFVVLDRCLVSSGGRSVVQGRQGSGRLVVRDSLLTGEAQGLTQVGHALLEGVVLAVGRDPFLGVGAVSLCPESVRVLGSGSTRPAGVTHDCPLGPR